jgi:hypothetical protein
LVAALPYFINVRIANQNFMTLAPSAQEAVEKKKAE